MNQFIGSWMMLRSFLKRMFVYELFHRRINPFEQFLKRMFFMKNHIEKLIPSSMQDTIPKSHDPIADYDQAG
jgi:hypothetical protein